MDKLKSLLSDSSLADHEQKELFEIFANLSKDELGELSDFLSIHPEWVDVLYRNYEKKKKAAVSMDIKKWREIFDEEKRELEKLAD
ncbi:hypothetical protein A2303_06940 [Candidatus Falkowbacteria bacterium RIFOXYB2_FULL_47_14]|uniref:Uncharacterized protein n=1 Tax=Candidatus Falkowbacteria bacterium RIFOXYA2_FULL_47_19 TaxID=1797994 RepID=A0A1F5SGC0_9BACT|nr:MAG: hypothetical protein A2227_00685 [Candidatus Falkowbacteria bacterium RIFOXYA2_FULL_47_19]OGF35484.1 MAG: hypothetical protein A2468_05585 [Candidatus Falkowbacteria bacterium RIFOXYC2_FULL_46_15]OGF43606.1 MAG: hypothetical protein A2303_06940 [Candidatus Falkowbacteria bacterium RIFOXYB2_FULL_47_14]